MNFPTVNRSGRVHAFNNTVTVYFSLALIFFFSCSRVLKLDSVNRKCDTMTHVTRRNEG